MSTGLTIRPDASFDFLSLGALVHRLDPGIIPFRKAIECRIHVSGGEFNVAANLADCFGLRTGVATAMVDYPIGDLIAERVRAMGVTPFYKRFKHDGVTGPNMATVYSDRGHGVRAPVVFYNRSNEAAAQLKPGDFDWKAIFGGGVRWFHSGGIFAALSETTRRADHRGHAGRQGGGGDHLVRPQLPREALEDLRRRSHAPSRSSAASSSTSMCSSATRRTCRRASASPARRSPPSRSSTRRAFFGMIDRVREKHPQVKMVATTLREVHSTNRHSWSAVAWINGQTHVAPTCELDVCDRVGGGDGFASGLIYGLLTGESPERGAATSAGPTARC